MLPTKKQILTTTIVLGLGAWIWLINDSVNDLPEVPTTYALVQAYPEYKDCELKVVVTGEVLLSHPLEIHPKSPAYLDGYTAIDYDYARIGPDTLTVQFKEPEKDILARVKSPVPDGKTLIGKWLTYHIEVLKPKCAPVKPKPVPKKRTPQ